MMTELPPAIAGSLRTRAADAWRALGLALCVTLCVALGSPRVMAQADAAPLVPGDAAAPADGKPADANADDGKPADPKPLIGIPKDDEEGGPPKRLEIDLDVLYFWPDAVGPAVVEDPVWLFRGTGGAHGRAGGAYYVQIPFIVKPNEKGIIRLGKDLVEMKNADFIAWKIEAPGAIAGDPRMAASKRDRGRNAEVADVAAGHPLHKDSPSRISTEVFIMPNGSVKWSIEKRFRTRFASLKPSAGHYSYKIDIKKLHKLRPKKPTRGKLDTPQARQAFKIKFDQFRADFKAFLDLQRTVGQLPTEIVEEETPKRIWAIFEVNKGKDDLTLTSQAAPFPWHISATFLNGVRDLAAGETGNDARRNPKDVAGALPVPTMATIAGILEVSKGAKSHPYSLTGGTLAISGSRLLGYCEPDDTIYELASEILKRGTAKDRALIVKEIVTTIPPTSGTIALLKRSKEFIPDAAKDIIAGETIKPPTDTSNAEATNKFLKQIFDGLASSDGVPTSLLLEKLMEFVANNKGVVGRIVQDMPFESMPQSRLKPTIVFVINKSISAPVAARWLNERLLGSSQKRIVNDTLDALLAAELVGIDAPPKPALAPGLEAPTDGAKPADAAASADATNPDGSADGKSADATTGDTKADGSQPSKPVAAVLNSGLPKVDLTRAKLDKRPYLYTPSHSFFKLLAHSDPTISTKAWRALHVFDLLPQLGSQKPDFYDVLMQAALSMRSIPQELIDFLMRQTEKSHERRVLDCLVTLVQQGQSAAKVKAARAVLGRGGPMQEILKDMSFEERFAFVRRLYEAHDANVPMVLGLMKQKVRDAPLLAWFARYLQQGKLPDASLWAAGFERDPTARDEKLLEMVSSWDEDLSRGAIAALVADAKGAGKVDDRMAQEMLRDWKKQGVTTDIDKLWPMWQRARQQIYAERLTKKMGTYRLRLRGPGANEILATIQIKMNDEKKLECDKEGFNISVPYRFFGIRLRKPEDMKALNNPLASRLPWSSINEDIRFMAQENGTFKAIVFFSRGGQYELHLEPESLF